MRVDLNADVGESFGHWQLGDDAALMPLLTSANIACGAHAGDPLTMTRTVRIAREAGVAVGAHPGYPDLAGFGRRALEMPPEELEAHVLAQLGALAAICRAEGVALRHVKPHGALYNAAAVDESIAAVIAHAVARWSRDLVLVGLAGSVMLDAGRAEGLRVASEAFADRRYESDGRLRSRRLPGSMRATPEAAAAQAVEIVTTRTVTTHDGSRIAVHADTLCLHGDTPGAVEYATAIRSALEASGVVVGPLALEA